MKQTIVTLVCLLAGIALGPSAAQAQDGLNGAWEIVESSGTTPAGDFEVENVQPNLYLFQDGYYSIMLVRGDEARPLLPEDANWESLTDEQIRATITPFVANSGTYEIDGTSLTTTPMVALWPNFMEGGSATVTFEVDDDVMTLVQEMEGWSWTGKLRRLK